MPVLSAKSKKAFFVLMSLILVFGLSAQTVFATSQMSATQTDSISNDQDTDGVADPGDRVHYQTVITNTSGTQINGIIFDETPDSNTSRLPAIKVSPITFDDSYTAIGNVTLSVNPASGLLSNDVDPNDLTLSQVLVTDFQNPSTNGGTVLISADGSFTYLTSPGYKGTDTFTYTITDGDGYFVQGTVTIQINDVVWFVNNSGINGNGTKDSPFSILASAQTASATNDIIFVYYGTGTTTGLNAGITLKAGQQLIGQGVDLVVNAQTIVAASSKPLLTRASSTVIQIANGCAIKGLKVNGASGTAISGSSTTGALTIQDVDITNQTTAAINVTGAAGSTATLTNVAVTNSGGTGLSASSFGTVSITDLSVTTTNGSALSLTGAAGSIAALTNIAVTNSGGTGLSASTFGTVTITGSSVATTNGTALSLASCRALATFTSLSSTNATGQGVSLTSLSSNSSVSVGTTTVNGADSYSLYASSVGSGSTLTFTTVNIPTRDNYGIYMNQVNGTLNLGTVTISNPGSAGDAFVIASSAAVVSVTQATISSPNGHGIRLENNALGTFTLRQGSITSCVGCGITASYCPDLALTNVTINGTGSHGFSASSVADLSMTGNCKVQNAGDANDENGLTFANVMGTVLLEDLLVEGCYEDGIEWINTSGSTTATLRRAVVRNNNSTYGENGLTFRSRGTAAITAALDTCSFTGLAGDGVNSSSEGSGNSLGLALSGNTFSNNGGRGLRVGSNSSASATLTTPSANTFTTMGASPVKVKSDGSSSTTATVSGNTINGSTIGTGIDLWRDETSNMSARVASNTISNTNYEGIYGISEDGAGLLAMRVNNNTLSAPTGTADGMKFVSNNTSTLCLYLHNNSSAGYTAYYGYNLRQLSTSTFNLQGYATSAAYTVNTANSNTGTVTSTGTFTGATCSTP